MTTIRKIDVGSAFKVGLVLNALIFAIIGLIFALMQIAFGNLMMQLATSAQYSGSGLTPEEASLFQGANVAISCVFWLFGSVIAGIFGGIYFAIAALLYNLTAKWVGGLEIQLSGFNPSDTYDFGEPASKRKRVPADDIL